MSVAPGAAIALAPSPARAGLVARRVALPAVRSTGASRGSSSSATRRSFAPRPAPFRRSPGRRPRASEDEGASDASAPAPPPPPPPPPAPPPAPESSPGRAIAGAGFALGVALFVGGLGGGAPTLASLEKDAIPLDAALGNGRPTVVEFYADWCEVCKASAPDVFDVERRFGDSVNFVMLNIDNTKWGGEMDQYGVDGIPHIVFLDEAGRSEGQVVGKFPKQALEANVQALSVGAKTLPFAKGSFEASAVVAPDIVGAPQSAVDDPRGGAVSSADPRAHG